MSSETRHAAKNETPLQGWKDIGAYLQRTERTAKRWEAKEGLPVHRHRHGTGITVYAYPSELDAWRTNRAPEPAELPLWRRLPWRPLPAFASTIALGLMLLTAGGPPSLGPVEAQAADGIVTRQVWADPGVDTMGGVSPDSRHLTFVDWDTGDLAVRDLTTGKNRRLTNKGSWVDSGEFAEFSVVSPDGKQVAYTWYSQESDAFDLRITDLDGAEARVIHSCDAGGCYVKPLSWSPDGKRIFVAFKRDRATYRIEGAFVSVADGSVEVLATLPWSDGSWGSASLSPDGRYVVYDRLAEGSEQHDISLFSTDGNLNLPLVRHPADDCVPVWTPDGTKVLFASDRTGALSLWSIQVVDGKPQGSPELVKAGIGPLDRIIGFTGDGSLYYALNTGMEDVFIAELDPATGRLLGQPTRILGRYVGSNRGPMWSPDGQYLAYQSRRGSKLFTPGALVIVIRSMETGEEHEISTRLIQCGPVHWFPDGQSLLVSAYRDVGRDRVDYYRIDVRSGEVSLIRRSERGRESLRPDLSPDGKKIFFTHTEFENSQNRRISFVAYDIETRQEAEIHRVGERKRVWNVLLSPDGRQLAFIEWDEDTRSDALKVMRAEGGSPRELLRPQPPEYLDRGSAPAWTPDGRYLLVSKMTDLLRVPVGGGDAQHARLVMRRIGIGNFHPDGRRITFKSGRPREFAHEIWVMENFLPGSPAD